MVLEIYKSMSADKDFYICVVVITSSTALADLDFNGDVENCTWIALHMFGCVGYWAKY